MRCDHVQPPGLLLLRPLLRAGLPGPGALSSALSLAAPHLKHQAGLRGRREEEGGSGEDPGGDGGYQEAEDGPLQVQVHHAQEWHQGTN